MKIRHYFAGGNTPVGFYSYYNEILPQEETRLTVYLKGGAGTGKSTLMKKWGTALAEAGHPVEFLHCSGDPASLDGVVARESGVCVVDGTAPHAQDPKILANECVFDPGRFIDREKLLPYREELMTLSRRKKDCYARAYRNLSAAGTVYEGVLAERGKALSENALYERSEQVLKELFADCPVTPVRGQIRHGFAAAITPRGVLDYSDTLFDGLTRWQIIAENGLGVHTLLDRVATAALAHGMKVEAYCSPLFPKRIEHLVLTDLGVALTTAEGRSDRQIDLASCLDESAFAAAKRRTEADFELFDLLLTRTVEHLREAGEEHARMEERTVPAMDFPAMEEEFSRILTKMDGLTKG